MKNALDDARTYFLEKNWLDLWSPHISLAAALVGAVPSFATINSLSTQLLVFPFIATAVWHRAATNRCLEGTGARAIGITRVFPPARLVAILGVVLPSVLAYFYNASSPGGYAPPWVAVPLMGAWAGFWFLLANTLTSLFLHLVRTRRPSLPRNLHALRMLDLAALGLVISLSCIAGFLLREGPGGDMNRLLLSGVGLVLGILGVMRAKHRLRAQARWWGDAKGGLIKGIRIEERVDEATDRVEHIAVEVESEDGGAYRSAEMSRREVLLWDEPLRRT